VALDDGAGHKLAKDRLPPAAEREGSLFFAGSVRVVLEIKSSFDGVTWRLAENQNRGVKRHTG